ncbi:MAG: caspase family protein [Ferruginibacter sp.]|nr:caspase family protein [Ferruginibacter sp.]
MGSTFDKEKSFAVLVGVGKRADQQQGDSELMAITAVDAQYLKWALETFGIFSANEGHIKILVDQEAKKKHITDELDLLAAKTAKEPADLVIIYFSGHGSKQGNNYHLICQDTINDDLSTGIAGSEFVKKLEAIQCDKLLVLLDCCHSEGMTDIPFEVEPFLKQEHKNRIILTACHKSQFSYLSKPVSIFTYALIEGLGGKFLIGGDTDVGVLNLAMDTRERVVALSGEVKKMQQDILKSPAAAPVHFSDEVKQVQQPQLNVLKESGIKDFTIKKYPAGANPEMELFDQQFSSLKLSNSKDIINTTVAFEPDNESKAYRNSFNWMVQTNTVQDIGNGNYILQGVTINNGLTMESLKEILDHLELKDKSKDKITAELIEVLKNKNDNDSKELWKKIEGDKTEQGSGEAGAGLNDNAAIIAIDRKKLQSEINMVRLLFTRLMEIEKKLTPENNAKLTLDKSKIKDFKNSLVEKLKLLKNVENGVAVNDFTDLKENIRQEIDKQTARISKDLDKKRLKAIAEDEIGDEEFENTENFLLGRIESLKNIFKEIEAIG